MNRIRVVNLAESVDAIEQIKSTYRQVFPNIKDDQFELDGALAWARRIRDLESTEGT